MKSGKKQASSGFTPVIFVWLRTRLHLLLGPLLLAVLINRILRSEPILSEGAGDLALLVCSSILPVSGAVRLTRSFRNTSGLRKNQPIYRQFHIAFLPYHRPVRGIPSHGIDELLQHVLHGFGGVSDGKSE